MLYAKWQPFCLNLNVLIVISRCHCIIKPYLDSGQWMDHSLTPLITLQSLVPNVVSDPPEWDTQWGDGGSQ